MKGGRESSSLIRSVARVDFSRISRAARNRGRGRDHAGMEKWKAIDEKLSTPCRWPRLNINYRPCSTVNASLFVEIRSWEEEARYNKRDTIIAGGPDRFAILKKGEEGSIVADVAL